MSTLSRPRVRLIFHLYDEGDGISGPRNFWVGPVHVILTNRCYPTGKWPYGVRNSRTGQRCDPASIVEIDVPTIIPMELFEGVQSRLAAQNPKVTPPRVVNGPTLLTGLAVCASCGAGMTRTGTRRGDRSYS